MKLAEEATLIHQRRYTRRRTEAVAQTNHNRPTAQVQPGVPAYQKTTAERVRQLAPSPTHAERPATRQKNHRCRQKAVRNAHAVRRWECRRTGASVRKRPP